MGIRFYCPNGHRLHVKSFLAGKRGICPHCTARFRIPPESEIPRGSPKIKPDSQAAVGGSNGKRPSTAATATATVAASVDIPEETETRLRSLPATSPVNVAADPIAEAPEAIWYVRPPSGGQYGPAKGDVMRRWLTEGRVSPDSLVWREGWSDWVTAGPVFPILNPTYTAPAATSMAKREAVSLQLQSVPSESPSGSRPATVSARTVAHQKSLAPVILLVLTVVVLIVVFIVVLATKH